MMEIIVICCADCGGVAGEGISLKACKSCMFVKYCNAECQKNHWPKHKAACKQRAAELRDEALFKDPPAKEDCPICFLPMPTKLISCMTLPPATISSVPIDDFAKVNEELANLPSEQYYACCGKSVCGGCVHSFRKSGNMDNCPYCRADKMSKTVEENVEELMKRAEANNDAAAKFCLGSFYDHGQLGVQQDVKKAMELWTQAAELGSSSAHSNLGNQYRRGGDLKKAKFHYEAAAMAGEEVARLQLGTLESEFGNIERAVKHFTIAASGGHYNAMQILRKLFEKGYDTVVCRDVIDSTLTAYNHSCAEMRSDGRDAAIRAFINRRV